eukprot:GHVN01092275.1.p1 GENE.GHVN01092275.1~~GHVN01092275.1.p1  ORF type:complete len:339 (+),score=12.81 GHVN01092275.1:69-1085(+)
MTAPTQNPPTASFAATILKEQCLPVFGAPSVLLADNGAEFIGKEFKHVVTQELCAHLVFASPYYPQGNAINEACRKSIEHGLKCAMQLPTKLTFPEILRDITIAHNAAYHSSIGDAPFAVLLGKPPVLPGFQHLTVVTTEDSRKSALKTRRARDALLPHLEGLGEEGKTQEVPEKVKLGDFVIYLRSDYERTRMDEGAQSFRYSPKWSLPAKVTQVGTGVLRLLEYGTAQERKVPISQVKVLPVDLPLTIRKINWEHIQHCFPRRGFPLLTPRSLPETYRQLKPTEEWEPDGGEVAAKEEMEEESTTSKQSDVRHPSAIRVRRSLIYNCASYSDRQRK